MAEQSAGALVSGRDRWAIPASIALLAAGCWLWTARMALQPMPAHHHHEGMGAGPGALFLMWAVMMAAMMLPPELPLFADWLRKRRTESAPATSAALFLVGFLLVWTAYSFGAAALHAYLQEAGMMDMAMALKSAPLGGAVLILIGLSQLTPLKRICLIRCRRAFPASAGGAASVLSGLRAGLISVASCGALMLLVFVPGVMSLTWMVLLTALLVLERVSSRPFWISAGAGGLLIAWGLIRIAVGWQTATPID